MNRSRYAVAWVLVIAACHAADAPEEEESDAPAGSAASDIALSKSVAERAGITSVAAKRAHLARPIHAPAEIVLNPDLTAHLAPLVDARIEKVSVALGDQVKRGALLAVLRSVAVGESQSSLAQAQADLELARANLKRQEDLRAANIGAARNYDEAVAGTRRAEASTRAARQRAGLIGTYELRAPINGTVIDRHASIGEVVGPQTVLFTLADLDQVWVVGQVYERDVGAIAAESKATLTLEAYPGHSWSGKLSYVAGALQHETRTLPVRLTLDNQEGKLRPGLFGTLEIEASDAFEALAIPAAAVQRIDNKTLVFVRQASPDAEHVRFSPREVTLGIDTGALVEVKAGLGDGEEVASSGTFTLRGVMLRDTLSGED